MTGFRHAAQRRLAPLYVQGLCSFSARKSMTPMAETVAPGQGDHFQHFITDSPWDTQPLETLVAQQAQRLVGGQGAVLIIDDTCLTKFGASSVGVSPAVFRTSRQDHSLSKSGLADPRPARNPYSRRVAALFAV